MVHALKEIWRVLVPGGLLLDLRPIAGNWPVEVVEGEKVTPAGPIDDAPSLPIDTASNESLVEAGREGWFTREREASFDFFFYWDAADEMKAFIDEKWVPDACLPDEVLAEARRLMAGGEGRRVRVRVNMVISRWRKRLES